MLHALESSPAETEEMLARQRQFVADASHELRTPLTSVLANLELLAEVLDGEQGEAARAPCAPPIGCGGSSPTCSCSPAPTPAVRSATFRPMCAVVVEAPAELGPVAVALSFVDRRARGPRRARLRRPRRPAPPGP